MPESSNLSAVDALIPQGNRKAAAIAFSSKGQYCFLVCEDLRAFFSEALVSTKLFQFLDDDVLTKTNAFEISSAPNRGASIFPSVIAGAVLSRRFADGHPAFVEKLSDLIPLADSGDATFVWDERDDQRLTAWALARAFRLANRFVGDLSRAHAEIASLQRLTRDQIEALQTTEASIPSDAPRTPKLGLVIPPSSVSVLLNSQQEPGLITQHSKREFRAVHSFDLFVTSRGARNLSPIRIKMKAAHSGKPLGNWSMVERVFAEGWNRFEVASRPTPLDEPVIIEVGWEPDGTGSLKLGLGETVADKRWVARGLGVTIGDRPLALRIFEGTPSRKLPASGFNVPSEGEPNQRDAGLHNLDHMLTLARFWSGSQGEDKTSINYAGTEKGLQVHPTGRQPVVAIIQRIVLHNAISLKTDIVLDHEPAADTEFGLFAARSTGLSRPAPQAKTTTKLLSLFGRGALARAELGGSESVPLSNVSWMALRALEEGSLSFEFDAPISGPVDIFLLTRGVTNDTTFAWAQFRHLAVQQSGETLELTEETPDEH